MNRKSGDTILESQGMGSAILSSEIRSVPLFGFLKSILDESHPYNKTIFTVPIDNIYWLGTKK
ncbi:MAG: hypothetical protein GX913_01440 [Clostridiales bacterium]|nr:hypothetical protein [Clostridiales bacterium]